jgi:protein tyrosine/serine phosphatase
MPGLSNLHKVSDDLYRGAQPTAEGFKSLKEMGIKTVVNLRSFHSDTDEMEGLAFDYVDIPVKAWHAEDEDVVRFLKIVTDKTKAPVFVHCEYGADRTGMMVAIYRIAVQGWSKEDAMKEMTEGGFGWHPLWQNLLHHIRDLDVEALKKAAGLAGPKQRS